MSALALLKALWANMSEATSAYLSHAYQGPWAGLLGQPSEAVRPAKFWSATGSFNK